LYYEFSLFGLLSERMGLTLFISNLLLCTTVVVKSAITCPDSSRNLMCQHTKVPCHR